MQIWPLLSSLVMRMRRAARSRFAVSSTMTGLLPPSSRVTGVRCSAAAFITMRPTVPLPVYMMWSNLHSRRRVVSGTAPWTTRMHDVSKYLCTRRSRISAHFSDISLGLMTAQFPAAMQATNGSSASVTGKLKGAMIRHTPLGSGRTNDLPSISVCGRFLSAVQALRLSSAVCASVNALRSKTPRILGPPRSACSASRMASWFSSIISCTCDSCWRRHFKL
mmetsp:Transcript_16286/g.28854  ORF Transcript_16286/g.28854 Transcript_16286/m.28854 type:complete len:221 (-) Transcript_16286:190-852(-)